MVKRHLGQQSLEAGSRLCGPGTLAEVLVDDEDAVSQPSPRD
jgi:hypothetical protein